MDQRAPAHRRRGDVEPLWREVTGHVLRRHRHDLGERLVETAERASVSSQYLSELERGRKDASSEVLAAVAGALGLSLVDLTCAVSEELVRRRSPLPVLRAVGAPPPMTIPPMRYRGPVALAA